MRFLLFFSFLWLATSAYGRVLTIDRKGKTLSMDLTPSDLYVFIVLDALSDGEGGLYYSSPLISFGVRGKDACQTLMRETYDRLAQETVPPYLYSCIPVRKDADILMMPSPSLSLDNAPKAMQNKQ